MTSTFPQALQDKIDAWLQQDPYEPTRTEIQQLVEAKNESELSKLLMQRIAFGTAGLRARMAAGFACMNPLIVIQTTQGLVKYLEQVYASDDLSSKQQQGVVVGYDGRHNSKLFAQLIALVFLSSGFKVYLYGQIVGTPLVPYAVRKLQNVAGIMVTASHNPKQDNGYKLYWNNGCQIIEPHDQEITRHISQNLAIWDNVKQLFDQFVATKGSQNEELAHYLSQSTVDPFNSMTAQYFEDVKQYSFVEKTADLYKNAEPIVFTAMHGVGAPFVTKSFAAFQLPEYVPVTEQNTPDPEFPTVQYPNPEEGKGALALAIATADRVNSRLILANDPDADRLAVAEKQENGEWRVFNGNEIAFLLASWVWEDYKKKHSSGYDQCVMIASTVSSKILKAMAKAEGFKFEETLTGFKWIGNKADEVLKAGKTFLFGYEVEIGFLPGDISLDKDGIRTAAVFAEMAHFLYRKEANYSLGKHLTNLYNKYGWYLMRTRYFFSTPPKANQIFGEIRANYPTEINYKGKTYKIKSIRDLTVGYDNAFENNKPTLPITPDSQMITFTFDEESLGGFGTATLRNSGTEPKLKWYVEVSDADKDKALIKLNELTEAVIQVFIQPSKYELQAPSD